MILQKSFKYADLVPKKHIFLLISKIFWCKTYFSRFFKFKRTVFIFFDLKNVFTVTFDQLNASLLNKNMNLWEKKILLNENDCSVDLLCPAKLK